MGYRKLEHNPPDLEAKPHTSVPRESHVDLWIRNPISILNTALAEGVRQFTWHRGIIEKRKMNIISHMRRTCAGFDVKYMLIGREGTAEYNLLTSYTQPLAVYPTWCWGDSLDELLHLLRNPVGANPDLCANEEIPPQVRPVLGQKHRIIISNLPPSHGAEGKHAFSLLDMLQDTFPQAELFVSGPSSLAVLFGRSFRAVDFDPAWSSGGNILLLPSGAKVTKPELYPLYQRWVELVGFRMTDIATRQGRIHFAMRSARWASRRFKYDYALDRIYEPTLLETMQPTKVFQPKPGKRADFKNADTGRIAALAGGLTSTRADMALCNECIFQISCTTYRADSICNRKGSEFVGLSEHFGTRDPDKIIGGLAELLRMSAERLEGAMEKEKVDEEPNPEVTRQINSVFKNSTQLAKLLDPERLGGGTKVSVNVGVGPGGVAAIQAVSFSNPKELTSAAVKALEAYGIPREKITGEMITGLLKSMATGTPREAIEGTVVKYEEGLS